jgi:hypothetical protein
VPADTLVVRDDVTRDESAQSVEHGLGNGHRPFDLTGLTQHREHVAVVGRREAHHCPEDTTNVVLAEPRVS